MDETELDETWQSVLKGFGVILLGLASLVGFFALVIVAGQDLIQPAARGHHALALLIAGAIATLLLGGLAAKASIEPSWARVLVITLACVFGFMTYTTYVDRRDAREMVKAYCSYGSVSRAQLGGCEDHVVASDVLRLHTRAAQFATGSEEEQCGATSGPFCQRIVQERLWNAARSDSQQP